MAAAMSSPPPPVPVIVRDDDGIMDTRTDAGSIVVASPAVGTPENEKEKDDAEYQPDLGAEVALLSTKLVNAINLQTTLDDTLQHTRHDLDQTRQKCDALEAENKRLTDMITDGDLMKKREVDEIVGKIRAELQKEKAAREAADRAKKQTEGELENLTTALFEEANTMVAAARKEVETVERRNVQLKNQLKDTEVLMESQQEQLRDLKETLEKLQNESRITRADIASMPSTPTVASSTAAAYEASASGILSPHEMSFAEHQPNHPLHFSQLIAPMLRHDTTACTEFRDLLTLTRRLGAHSRTNSSQGGGYSSSSASQANLATTTTSSSSPSMPGGFSFSTTSSPSSNAFGNVPPLKDSRYYKRVLSEDLEPTLRLDIAPGLSFLSRRTVLSSLLSGSLAIEPFPPNKHYFACALCGESRRSDEHVRKYHFRTSEDDTAPKPLCDLCLGRVRATCDFVGFLRMARDGHLRGDTEEEMQSAWEENVKLRERMFWARVGGGVVPSVQLLLSAAQQQQQQGVRNSSSSNTSSPGKLGAAAVTTNSLDAVLVNSVPLERKRSAVERPKSYVTPPGSSQLRPQDGSGAAVLSRGEDEEEPTSAVSDASGPFEDARQEVGGDADVEADASTPTEKDVSVQKRPRAVSLLPDLPVVVPAEKEEEKRGGSKSEIREVANPDADGDEEEGSEMDAVPRVSVEVADEEETTSAEVGGGDGGDAADVASREDEDKDSALPAPPQDVDEDTAAASGQESSRADSQLDSTIQPAAASSVSASADSASETTTTAPSSSASTSKRTSVPVATSSSSSPAAATAKRLSAVPRTAPSSARNSTATATSLAPSPANSRPGSRQSIRSSSSSSVLARVKAMESQE